MLTVEIRDAEKARQGGAEIEIFCDTEGLILLKRQLEFLTKGSSHVHLMSQSWAGNELDEVPIGDDTDLVHHLKIMLLQSPSP